MLPGIEGDSSITPPTGVLEQPISRCTAGRFQGLRGDQEPYSIGLFPIMKILFAGTPGLRKSVALRNLCLAIKQLIPEERVFTQNPSDPSSIPVLDHLLYDVEPITFLQQSQERQKQQWMKAFESVRKSFKGSERDHHFLGIHFTYRFEQVPSCVVSLAKLIEWKPDRIVTFIDDAYDVRERIHKGGYTSFTLAELVMWRVEEIMVGDLLARLINPDHPPPNYVVAIKHPAMMLARLLLRPRQTARIYLSHDISDARKSKQYRHVIDSFRTEIRKQENCAVFEPLTIDELPPVLPFLQARKKPKRKAFTYYDPSRIKDRWPTLDPADVLASDEDLHEEYPLKIPMQELKDAAKAIDAQVSRRDIRLVEQSHYLLVYRPTITGDPRLGTGVVSEVRHAWAIGRPILWYIKRGKDPLPKSPFVPKNPADNPRFIYESSERKLWEKVNQLHQDINPECDHFLREQI